MPRLRYRRPMHRPHLHGPRTLALIAALKFVKSISLVVLAIILLRLRHPETGAHFREWLGTFPLATGHELIDRAIRALLGMSTHTMGLVAAIALGYAVLYARSEERRVGKECRFRRWRGQSR